MTFINVAKEVNIMVKNVRAHLLTAFDKLIQAHSLDPITVYQICQTAGVSRQSFYYHFGDIVDLLSAYIQETFNQQMDVYSVPFCWSQSFEYLLRYIQKNQVKFSHIYYSKFFFDFKQILEDYAKSILRPTVKARAHYYRIPLHREDIELIVWFFKNIFVEEILHFVDNGAISPSESVMTKYLAFVDLSMDGVVIHAFNTDSVPSTRT